MRRLSLLSAIFLFAIGMLLGGCKRNTPPKDDDKQVEIDPGKVKVDPPVEVNATVECVVVTLPGLTRVECGDGGKE